MAIEPTWEPHEKHGDLTERSDLADSVFAFPEQQKKPLTDASHVRDAVARFCPAAHMLVTVQLGPLLVTPGVATHR